jgi:hypothetical protein
MIGVRLKKLKVLDAVVVIQVVQMMNHLGGEQVAPKVGLHHQAVLPNIAARMTLARSALRVGVLLNPHQNVPIGITNPAALPVGVTGPRPRAPRLHRDPMLSAQGRDALVRCAELIGNPSVCAIFRNPRADLIDRPFSATVRVCHANLLRW